MPQRSRSGARGGLVVGWSPGPEQAPAKTTPYADWDLEQAS